MTFFRRLRVNDLIELCRSMRYALLSGLMLRDVMNLLAKRGTRRIRWLATDVGKELSAGWSLPEALEKQEEVLPPLFISLAVVGEESGNLPEVLGELERYYILRRKLRIEFSEQISWPVLQFVAAILIVTLLIYILGILPRPYGPGSPAPLDPLGLGLIGPRGAAVFFGSVCAILGSATALFLLVRRLLRRRAVVDRVLLALPAIGPWLRAAAIARLCLAGRLMLETSLSILKTLRLAFVATDNAAFMAVLPRIEGSLRQGNSIASSLDRAKVFPEKFLSAVGIGEESGRLPETLRAQGEEYDDEARRRLGWLTRLAGWAVSVCVAGVLIVCIFQIFTNLYLKNIDRFVK
jgi:type IV pilus assembly protein PilC